LSAALPIPRWVWGRREIFATAKDVLRALVHEWAHKKAFCWPADVTIANAVGKSVGQVQRALRLLEQRGLIFREATRAVPNGRRIWLCWRALPAGVEAPRRVAPARIKGEAVASPAPEGHNNIRTTETLTVARAPENREDRLEAKVAGEVAASPIIQESQEAASEAATPSPCPVQPSPQQPQDAPLPAALPYDPDALLADLVKVVPGLPAEVLPGLAVVFCERLAPPDGPVLQSFPFWKKVLSEVATKVAPVGRLKEVVTAAWAAKRKGGAHPSKIAAYWWRYFTESDAAREARTTASRVRAGATSQAAAPPAEPTQSRRVPLAAAVPEPADETVEDVAKLEQQVREGDRGLRRLRRQHLVKLSEGGPEVPSDVQAAAVAALERIGPAPK
jgi:hypothetical protein